MQPASYIGGMYPLIGEPAYPELWRGCVGAWAPCLGPTGLTLRDWSGYQNHGTLTNMVASSDWLVSSGRYALDLDGLDDSVEFGNSSILNCSTAITISMWAKRNGTAGGAYHGWIQRFSAGSVGYQLYVNNSDNILRFYTSTIVASTYTMSDTLWHHLMVTNNGSTTTFFVDGIQYNSVSQSLSNVLTSTVNNFGVFGAGGRVNGQIDDMRIYNRALTAAENKILASRRGIAYDLAPRKRTRTFAGGFKAYWAARKAQILGGGL